VRVNTVTQEAKNLHFFDNGVLKAEHGTLRSHDDAAWGAARGAGLCGRRVLGRERHGGQMKLSYVGLERVESPPTECDGVATYAMTRWSAE
jgi:hypothetical protein